MLIACHWSPQVSFLLPKFRYVLVDLQVSLEKIPITMAFDTHITSFKYLGNYSTLLPYLVALTLLITSHHHHQDAPHTLHCFVVPSVPIRSHCSEASFMNSLRFFHGLKYYFCCQDHALLGTLGRLETFQRLH